MGVFELDHNLDLTAESKNNGEECIIAQKIFDQCRIQKCLSPAILGPARAARNIPNCNEMLCEGDIIVPPCNAASVSIKNLELAKIEILSKKQSPLKNGCWDIELKYVFEYDLEFRKADGNCIGCIAASSIYTQKVTLFGSSESEVTVASDLYGCGSNPVGGPFVTVEGKAVSLQATLKYASGCGCGCGCGCGDYGGGFDGCGCGCDCDDMAFGAPVAVNVTIGLFTIVKLFRTVNMIVKSLGDCKPRACVCPSSVDPCQYFDCMEFPMDVFSPNAEYHPCCTPGMCSSPDCVDSMNTGCGCGCGCGNGCGCGCGTGCGSTCGTSCGSTCGTSCGSTCGTSCGSTCGTGCGSTCGNGCGSTCGNGCGSTCGTNNKNACCPSK